MDQYDGIAAAADAVRRFFIKREDDLPEVVREKVEPYTGTGSSPVDLIVRFTEAAYANRETVPQEGLAIAAGCADLINRDGYHGRLDGRVVAMIPVLRRDSGEKAVTGSPWPKKADDPEPNQEYVQSAAPEAPAPAPGEQPAGDGA